MGSGELTRLELLLWPGLRIQPVARGLTCSILALQPFRQKNISPNTASSRQPVHPGALQPLPEHKWREHGPGGAVPGPPRAPAECGQ